MTWFDTLRENLKTPWLDCQNVVPFSLSLAVTGEWTVDNWSESAPNRWTLKAHSSAGLEATWHAQFFGDTRALECWGEITHRGSEPILNVGEVMTLDAHFLWPDAPDGNLGAWIRSVNGVHFSPSFPTAFPPFDFGIVDRQLVTTGQVYSAQNLMSHENGRTSGESLPCAVVTDAREQNGIALFLEWSGLWRIGVSQKPAQPGTSTGLENVRVEAGIGGLNLSLQPGETLPLARLLVAAFEGDLEAGGNALRRHIKNHVMPKLDGREALPPTSFNHWFAFENNFTAEMLKPAVEASAKAGLEYFCADGGWFKGNFRDGIGNWEDGDMAKFPDGIAPFAEYVRSCGMKYGTWFEPEFATLNSEMHAAHPDWFYPSPHFFLMMNFGLKEVQEWWIARIVRAYEEWGMRWVRWDFNSAPNPYWTKNEGEGKVGWNQINHVQGFYRVCDEILKVCPDLLIEQCASGGHRIDLGTVRRGHTFWMNDITTSSDLVRAFQHGLNTVLPGAYANTNLCQARHDFSDYDFLSHCAGGFGYSGRIWEAPPEEFENFKKAVADFKSFRHLLNGEYSRPTGQPRRGDEYAKIHFTEGSETLTIEWNIPGKKRGANWRVESV